jgi:hypothetical protein
VRPAFDVAAPAAFGLLCVEAVVSILAQWPYQFLGPGSSDRVPQDFALMGTLLAPPLPLLIAFGVAAFLVGRKDRVGLIATLLMVPACAVIALGSFGEALAPGSPNVPREVQVGGGILGGILFLALLGAAAWAAQARRRAHYFSHSSVAP